MTPKKSTSGVSREQRIADEGLRRLEKQLQSGIRISAMVLQQWVKRYGDEAQIIIQRYNRDDDR